MWEFNSTLERIFRMKTWFNTVFFPLILEKAEICLLLGFFYLLHLSSFIALLYSFFVQLKTGLSVIKLIYVGTQVHLLHVLETFQDRFIVVCVTWFNLH